MDGVESIRSMMAVDEKNAVEAELIKAIRRADKTAFRALCRIYYDPLYRFLWRKTRDEETAKDLVQELFLNIWKNRANLDETQSSKAYLYRYPTILPSTISRKKCCDKLTCLTLGSRAISRDGRATRFSGTRREGFARSAGRTASCFHVEIRIAGGELQALAITGTFEQQPVIEVLASLCLTLHLKYAGADGKYAISR